tara:strand:- start:355 stop:543 length:189 start_codon:yes stop_codon:yes gene_type:complete
MIVKNYNYLYFIIKNCLKNKNKIKKMMITKLRERFKKNMEIKKTVVHHKGNIKIPDKYLIER